MKKLILLISIILLETSIQAQDYTMTSPEQLYIYQLINRPTPSNFTYVSNKTDLLGITGEGILYDLSKNTAGIYTTGKIKQVITDTITVIYNFSSTSSNFGNGTKITTTGKTFGLNTFEINYLISNDKVDSIIRYDFDSNKKILTERTFLKYNGSILSHYENIAYENDTINDWSIRQFVINNGKYTTDTIYEVDKVTQAASISDINIYKYGATQDTVSSFSPDDLILPIPLPSTQRIVTKNANNEIIKSYSSVNFFGFEIVSENLEFFFSPLTSYDEKFNSGFIVMESLLSFTGKQKLSTYKIYSVTGTIVSEGEFQNNKINIEGLSEGVYILYTPEGKSLKFAKR